MKNLQVLSPLLTSFLLASMALAQTGSLPDAPQPHASADVQLAQAQTTEPASQGAPQPSENNLITQAAPFPRFPRGPMPPPRGRAYPSAFAPRPPALSPVGALIGFGAGAALAAAATQDHTTSARVAAGLLGGGLCALIGGAIGNAFSVVGHMHSYHNWDDAQDRKHRKPVPRPVEPDANASSAPVPPSSAGSL